MELPSNIIGISAMVIAFILGAAFIYMGLVRIYRNRKK